MKWSHKTELSKPISANTLLGLLSRGTIVGNSNAECYRIRPLGIFDSGALTFCTTRKDIDIQVKIAESSANIIIAENEMKDIITPQHQYQAIIFVEDAKRALAELIRLLVAYKLSMPTTSVAGCLIHESAMLARNTMLGIDILIGADTVIFPNVTIYDDVTIGKNVVIHANCSIGHPGLGPIGDKQSGWTQFPDIGTVIIGNNVQLGANCTIARATLAATIIEDGVKIANMVNIGHNAHIEKNAVITSSCMIARGRIGQGAWIAPGATILPGVNIGENALVGTGAVVTKDVMPNTVVVGVPAKSYGIRKDRI